METNFSGGVQTALRKSREEALRLGHDYIGTEHLLLGLLYEQDNFATSVLKNLGVNPTQLKLTVDEIIGKTAGLPPFGNIPLTKSAEAALKRTYLEARGMNSQLVGTEHVLLSLLRDENSLASQILIQFGINYDDVKLESNSLLKNGENSVREENRQSKKKNPDIEMSYTGEGEEESESPQEPIERASKSTSKSKTPVLDHFGRDLNKLASEEKLDPIIGREKEIERVVQILSRRKKNNPVLIGEPGVGKTAIAEGLALRIIQRKVPAVLFSKRVVALDMTGLVSGTKFRGQFEERMTALVKELSQSRDVILFIDELHTIVGAGSSSGSLDAGNIFKPALARGELQCIGATTLNEYRENIEKDGALERRFQKVMIEPATADETLQILTQIKSKYESHHNVAYSKEAIETIVKLSERYIQDRFFPDKAIDVMDEAGSRIHLLNIHVPKEILGLEAKLTDMRVEKSLLIKQQRFEEAAKLRDEQIKLQEELKAAEKLWKESPSAAIEVSAETIASVVSSMTGVPVERVGQAESQKLLMLPELLRGQVVGQDEAVEKLAKALQRSRAGLKDANRPIGSFMFLGQTGVGKTELAKSLARTLFGSEDALIRIDMSEFMERFTTSRLVGAPPGYVGYNEGGELTEKVRRKPYSVILLDEIEKAHPEVFNMLLQVLDDGILTDSSGRKIDFKNTIIIMTSNIGARDIQKRAQGSIGFGIVDESKQHDSIKSTIDDALRQVFNPEFLNRLDDVIVFKELGKDHILQIVDISLGKLFVRFSELGIKIALSTEAKQFLADKGYDTKFGARPLRRAIQKHLEEPLAEQLLRAKFGDGSILSVDYDQVSDKLVFNDSKVIETMNAEEDHLKN